MKRTVLNEKLCWYGTAADAEFWDAQWLRSLDHALANAKIPQSLQSILRSLSPGDRILEAGCGRGQIVKALNQNGFIAEGIDQSPRTVEELQARGLPVKKMDIRRLEYPDSSFHAYLSLGVIEHFYSEEDSLSALKEAVRVTRPGGRIFCSVPFTNRIREKLLLKLGKSDPVVDPAIFYQRSYNRSQFHKLFESLPVRVDRMGYENPVKGVADEMQMFRWLRFLPVAVMTLALHRWTSIFNSLAHMIFAELTVVKQG